MGTTTTEPVEMATKPFKEHEWLKNLIGKWRIESEMTMEPCRPTMKTTGTSCVTSLGGLWAFCEEHETMPDGQPMTTYFSLGYDVSLKEYRACMVMQVSSHT